MSSRSYKIMNICCMILIHLLLLSPAVWGVTYYFCLDVPTALNTTDYLTNQIVKSVDAAYSLQMSLPAETEISSLCIRSNGDWLFTPAFPQNLGGTDYEPRDIIAYNGATYSLFLDGSAVGIPDNARIDALLLDSSNHAIISFDVPVNISSTEYSQSDLVLYNAGFSLYWDAQAAGVPSYANLVGAERDGSGTLVVTFDVPVTLSLTEFLPGQLIQWNGTAFSNYFVDAAWPTYSQIRDFAFGSVTSAGSVPDGRYVPGIPLMASKGAGSMFRLTWSASCLSSDNDYAIYQGMIGTFTSYAALYCTTGGATTYAFASPAGSMYYLVVPRNAISEGSYGRSSTGIERLPGSPACLTQSVGICP